MINQVVLAVDYDGGEYECKVMGQLRRENDKGDMYMLCREDGTTFQSNYIKKIYTCEEHSHIIEKFLKFR